MDAVNLGVARYGGIDFTLRAFAEDETRPWARCSQCSWSTSVQKNREVLTGLCKGHADLHAMPPVTYKLEVTVEAIDARSAEQALTSVGRKLDVQYGLTIKKPRHVPNDPDGIVLQ